MNPAALPARLARRHAPARLVGTCRSMALRRWLVGWLLIALPCFGVSITVAELLGTRHAHWPTVSAAVDPMQGWVDFRRAGRIDVSSVPRVRPHTHSIFERHHHDPADRSVVALDAAADDGMGDDGGRGADGGGSVVVPPLTPAASLRPSAGVDVGWGIAPASAVAGRDRERIERPPRHV